MVHVVFAWELGAGFGHLTPIAALGAELWCRGHRVTAIAPSLGLAQSMLHPLGIEVVELPPCPAPSRAWPISINYTANLLRNGFWHAATVAQRVLSWRQVLDQLKPNLLICDHAPSALLASRDAHYTRVSIGHGFTLPPLNDPIPGIQPWFLIPPAQMVQKDQAFLEVVNPILQANGIAPLKAVASLFDGVQRFLCIEADLDHYPIRSEEHYWGAIDPVAPLPSPQTLWKEDSGVFIYMSATNRFLEPLLRSLNARKIPVMAYISGLTAEQARALPQATTLHYLETPVDLQTVAQTCRAVVTHGGTLSASIFLRNGAKLLICPQDLEKAVLGARLKERQLGYSANWFSPQGLSEDQIDELLTPASVPAHLPTFAKQQATLKKYSPVEAIAKACEQLLHESRPTNGSIEHQSSRSTVP